MGDKGYSRRGLFGKINHYDEHGKKIGHSSPGLFGNYNNYDANGKKTGRSSPGLFGGYNHYDTRGRKVGHSSPGLFGSYKHYDSDNKEAGSSDPGLFGEYKHSSSGGCYVATCVYGSYDCPEVWTLRRYRDLCLAKTWFGRLFIRIYYAVSPTVVRLLGDTKAFKAFWKRRLDKMVARLNDSGYANTPYEDVNY